MWPFKKKEKPVSVVKKNEMLQKILEKLKNPDDWDRCTFNPGAIIHKTLPLSVSMYGRVSIEYTDLCLSDEDKKSVLVAIDAIATYWYKIYEEKQKRKAQELVEKYL